MAAKPAAPLEYHPLSKKFPRMAADVFKAFCADIAERGLDKPIELLDGMIFDGRHRYEACLQCDVEPRFVELSETTDGDGYVRAANLLRRHLTQDQIAGWLVEKRKEASENDEGGRTAPTPSNREIAKETGIHKGAIDRAEAIDKKAAPELKAAIANGEVKPRDAARIVNKSPAVQRKAVEKVKAGKAKTVTEAVKGKKGKPVPTAFTPFKEIDGACGKILAAIDRLADKHPAKFHKQAIDAQKHVMQIVKDWWIAVK
jgi:hypothetical protein